MHVGSTTSRRFTDEEVEALQLVADRLAVAVYVDRSQSERAAAAMLQESLLPSNLPSTEGWEFAARYVPSTDTGVSGDWYDVFELPGGHIGVVIGDVAGNGLRAAVVMGRLRSALRAYAMDYSDPAQVLGKLDRKATTSRPAPWPPSRTRSSTQRPTACASPWPATYLRFSRRPAT